MTDVISKPMGPTIPEVLTSDKQVDEAEGYTTFILSESQSVIDRPGTIRAVEGYGLNPGDMELQIYRPYCGNESCPLPPNAIVCPEPSILCMKTKTCVNPSASPRPRKELKEICKATVSGPQFSEYQLMRRVKLTILKGYFFIRLSKPRNLMPGDILALRTRGGKIAKRKLTSDEEEIQSSDWKVLDGNPDEPSKFLNSGQMTPIDDTKYLIRVFTYEDLLLTTLFEYPVAGSYSVDLKVTSAWSNEVLTKNKEVTVSEPIDKLRLRVFPPNAAVEYPVSVSIVLSSGTGVKLNWDFGDGTVDEDMVDVTEPNQKFTRVHNYTAPGVYRITAKAKNIQSDLTASHTLIAQHAVTKKWQLSSNSPQLLPGKLLMRLGKGWRERGREREFTLLLFLYSLLLPLASCP